MHLSHCEPHLSRLLLAYVVVVVRDEVPAHLREGVGDAGVRLRGRRERRDLHVKVLLKVHVLGVPGGAQLLLLGTRRGED